MNWKHRTIIVPIDLAEPARAACMALTGSASEGLFTIPLYSEGVTEPTQSIEELTQLLSMIDISEEEPYAAMERLGLSLAPNELLSTAI